MEEHKDMNNPELLVYRVERLEDAMVKLSDLTIIVTRWDERFREQGGLMQCNLHALRMEELDKKLSEVGKIMVERTKAIILVEEHEVKLKDIEVEMKSLRAYTNKAVGALVVLSIVIQALGPILTNFIKVHLSHP
jgi:hypothetical protein